MKNFASLLLLLALSACCVACQPIQTSRNSNMGTLGASCSTAKVTGMSCEACASVVSANIKKIDGVNDVQIDVPNGQVKIYTNQNVKISEAAIKNMVERSGYDFISLQPTCK